MPLDALATIKSFESGGRNIKQGVVDPSISTASGYYQITNSTWNGTIAPAINAPKVGRGTAHPNGVMDLSESTQTAGATYLYEKHGFSDWTCTGCNSALGKYVANHGGASAFALTGGDNSFTASDSAGDGSSGLPAISFTSADGSSSSAMPAVSDTPGPLSKPFTWLYDQTVTATQQVVDDDITAMQTAVGTYASGLITLALVCLGIRCLLGRFLIDRYARFVLTVCFVVPFIAVGSSFYQTYIVDPVLGLPAWWQGHLAIQNDIKLSGSGPAAMLDSVYNQVYHVIVEIWKATPVLATFWNGVALFGAWGIVTLSLAAVFMAYAMITLLAMILLVIGPVMIPMILFQFTAPLFYGWARATITLVLSMLSIDVVLTMFFSIMTNLMKALTVTGTPDTDLPSVWGCGLAMAMMGMSVAYVPRLIAMIGGGVAVSFDSVGRHMSGAALASTAMMPVNAARRFAGMR